MRVLALDSTTRAGSAALLEGNDRGIRLVDQRVGDPTRSHAERLPAELARVIEPHGLGFADIDLFAVAAGPGSFTGLRIGIATMQGLALVRNRPLIGVTALEALGEAGKGHAAPGTIVAVWMDAHRRDVFTALYLVDRAAGGETTMIEREGARVDDPAATLARWRELGTSPSVFIGGGAEQYGDTIRGQFPNTTVVSPPPLAAFVGQIAAARAAAGEAPHPAALQPVYVRRPDAELARERSGACRE